MSNIDRYHDTKLCDLLRDLYKLGVPLEEIVEIANEVYYEEYDNEQ